MSLAVSTLSMRDWRNVGERDIELSRGMTVLKGPNATGKTNTIEALQLLTTGSSFRHAPVREQVRFGAESGKVSARLEGDGRVVDVSCSLCEDKRRFTRNNKAVRGSALLGTLLSILFSPDDLTFVKGSASYRRDELDSYACQANRAYRDVLRAYTRSIEQRNRLLKEEFVDRNLLDVWDESVALGGATLLYHRLSLFRRLQPFMTEVYGQISGSEVLTSEYESSLGPLEEGLSRDDLRGMMADALAAARETDILRRQTTVGPHRDDFAFRLDGALARSFGSQGQQRSIVLAYKLAQVRLSESLLGERPILLLDDVMSELDDKRREAVASFVEDGVQTVVSTTHLGYFTESSLKNALVVEYG
jgi:DNA replication and repair protein RecF